MLIENFTVNLGKFWGNLDGVNLGKFGGNFGHDLGKLYWLELATLTFRLSFRVAIWFCRKPFWTKVVILKSPWFFGYLVVISVHPKEKW